MSTVFTLLDFKTSTLHVRWIFQSFSSINTMQLNRFLYFRIILRSIHEHKLFTTWHCRSQLKNVDSSGISTRTFGIPVCRSTCWAIESTWIWKRVLSNLSARDILARFNIFQLTSAVSDYHEKFLFIGSSSSTIVKTISRHTMKISTFSSLWKLCWIHISHRF